MAPTTLVTFLVYVAIAVFCGKDEANSVQQPCASFDEVSKPVWFLGQLLHSLSHAKGFPHGPRALVRVS